MTRFARLAGRLRLALHGARSAPDLVQGAYPDRRLVPLCSLGTYAWLAVAVAAGIIGLGVLAGFSARGPWDDAYMFVRYADNLIRHGTVAWNPGAEATYGLTSTMFLLVVLPIRLLVGENPALVITLSSVLCGVVFLGLLIILLTRYLRASREIKPYVVLFVFLALAASVDSLTPHFVSGMDTTFVLAFVTAYILLVKWHERRPRALSAILAGVWGGLAFWVRPDLLVYSWTIPLALMVWSESRTARRQALAMGGIVLAMTLLQVGLAWYYFSSPLPLPFYAKGLSLYGKSMYEQYHLFSLIELRQYLHSYWWLIAVLGAAGVLEGKRWWRQTSPAERGLLLATVAFMGYYALFVLQIMGFHQRFYHPTLPAIALLSAQAAAVLARRFGTWPDGEVHESRSLPGPGTAWRLACLIVGGVLLLQGVLVGERVAKEWTARRVGQFDLAAHYREVYRHWWYKLDELSRLPDGLIIATTEVGLPAAMNPHKAIIDIAGLNEREIAHKGFSAERLVREYRPDVIYLPHPHYREMIDEITSDRAFLSSYEYFNPARIGAVMGIALRRDSKYYPALLDIVNETVRDSPPAT